MQNDKSGHIKKDAGIFDFAQKISILCYDQASATPSLEYLSDCSSFLCSPLFNAIAAVSPLFVQIVFPLPGYALVLYSTSS